jgi:hypothetical protein
MGKSSFKTGLEGTTIAGEGARVKLYVSEVFECNTRNTEEGMVGQSRGKFVYH